MSQYTSFKDELMKNPTNINQVLTNFLTGFEPHGMIIVLFLQKNKGPIVSSYPTRKILHCSGIPI